MKIDKKPGFDPQMVDKCEEQIKNPNGNQPEEPQRSEEPNPFDMMQYQQFNKAPDNFIPMGVGMAESLLSDDGVPKEIKLKYWNVFHRDNVLTFLDQPRKVSKLLAFDISKIDSLNCTPYYDYTFKEEHEVNVIRNIYETKLDRALGVTGNVKNERTTLQSQFSEVKSINETSQMESTNTGFFKKLLGRR